MSIDSDIQSTNITMISNALAVSEYYDWMVAMFAPFLGRRTLEIGAGIGTISQRIVHHTRSLVVSDIDMECIKIIQPKLKTAPDSCTVEYTTYALGEPCPDAFVKNPFDSIVVINVLEHVKEDVESLAHFKNSMNPGARLIVFVPAIQAIYGLLDEALGHYRRYSRQSLTATLQKAGYRVTSIKYMNFMGILGWWFNGTVLRRKIVPESNFRYFKYLFPMVRVLESKISLPFGISLLAIAEKA